MRAIDLTNERISEVMNNEITEVALVGQVSLNDANLLSRFKLNRLDISQATFGMEQEEWSQSFGFSHCGWVCGNSGVRDVEVLRRVLEKVSASEVVLPDDVARRHINTIKKNKGIQSVVVGNNCKLFTMKDGHLYNKKGTIRVF